MDNNVREDIGVVKEGIRWLKDEVQGLRADVRELHQFKWRVAGGAAVLTIFTSAVGTVLLHYVK